MPTGPGTVTQPPVLEVSDLEIRAGARRLCRGLGFGLAAGQCWGLLGRNGIGKTSLLHTLAGLRPATAGSIRLCGRELGNWSRRRLAQTLGLLLQHQEDPFPLAVADVVLSGRHPHLGLWAWPGAADQSIAAAAIAQVGMAGLEGRNVQTLSAGERRRAAIATLLAQATQVLLLDEPISHLDLREQLRVLELFQGLARDGRTLLLSLHDPGLALRFCDHLLLMDGDRTLAVPTAEVGDAVNLSRLYRQSLELVAGPRGPLVVPI
jgi:iron complex transport system ATP-binding protein